jgi:hypothetical protein
MQCAPYCTIRNVTSVELDTLTISKSGSICLGNNVYSPKLAILMSVTKFKVAVRNAPAHAVSDHTKIDAGPDVHFEYAAANYHQALAV